VVYLKSPVRAMLIVSVELVTVMSDSTGPLLA
jgi:hypothetical protein